MTPRTVRVPAELAERFARIEELVSDHFEGRRLEPARGRIEVFGERYVLIRAASLSVEFFKLVRDLYGEERQEEADGFARNILYDLAFSLGRNDARKFHEALKLEDPVDRLAAGPIHFSHIGWAFVHIHDGPVPQPGKLYELVYDHPYSFEADAWIGAGVEVQFPVCIMNAGYSSGWCSASFDTPLIASEVLCRARGDDACRFIMAHPEQIEERVERYAESRPLLAPRVRAHRIPDFFARKRIEEELKRARDELEVRVQERTADLREANERLREEMSQRIAAEKKLLEAAKLEVLGRLAGGIAHDFNNLMSVVLGHATVIERRLAPDNPVMGQVEEIKNASRQAASLTQQLLAFSRARLPRTSAVEVDVAMEAMKEMLARLLGERIQLVLTLSAPDGWVGLDDAQLTQVIMNLALNARDAMLDGGFLTVATELVDVAPDTSIDDHEVAAGSYVLLTIADEGIGMSDATLAKAFEPFFTTKGEKGGTGLGLSTVRSVVMQASGSVSASTVLGGGTRFRIYLPRVERPSDAPPEPKKDVPRGDETLLLVEDQAAVRRMLTQLLEGLGYTVLAARDPDDALALASSHDGPVHLLITDVVLPGRSGPQLADQLADRQPGLPVLYVSGYHEDEVLRFGIERGTVDLVPKPFTANEIAHRVRQALDRERQS